MIGWVLQLYTHAQYLRIVIARQEESGVSQMADFKVMTLLFLLPLPAGEVLYCSVIEE